MHLIYEKASFTIVAAGGRNANTPLAGLFSPRSPEPVQELVLSNKSITIAPARPALPDLLAETTWSKRGWTFQEDVLSRCCLYFTATEVFYSCRHHLLEYRLPCCELTNFGGDEFKNLNYEGFGYGRFSEWRESYFLETRISKTAYQDTSQWNEGWKRFGNSSDSLRSKSSVLGSQGVAGSCGELDYKSATWDPQEVCPGTTPDGHDHVCVHRIPANKSKRLFDEYSNFVAQYSKRELSYSSDAVTAMMGILNKFNESSAKPVNIEAHGILSDQLEKGLLWVPLNDNSLQRRSGFPSWSWAGWAGSVVYEVTHVRDHSGWAFQPSAVRTKTGSLLMEPLFDVRMEDKHRMFAYLRRSETATAPRTYPPAYDQIQGGSSSILRIYTYATEIYKLIFGVSFVTRQYATFMDLPVLIVQASNNIKDRITVIPDCGSNLTTTPLSRDPGLYKLAIIGRGERHEQTGQGCYSKLDTPDDRCKFPPNYTTRKGLTTSFPSILSDTHPTITMCTIVFTKYRCRVCNRFVDQEIETERCHLAKESGNDCAKKELSISTIHTREDNCEECLKKKKDDSKGMKRKSAERNLGDYLH
ncbi:hypothetical protein BKA59DRAFT_540492 [Fusarium tricinctum]|uniref:Heterokaryon incompatibility domain-containing protein n=1 Tax=Fusarium tricinctum TaxID=61284 RepID=A0A8K0SB03_9HYPO|nr:hypothetical protein BKA59DRAFT_540492 [Fusarium tricinctum]